MQELPSSKVRCVLIRVLGIIFCGLTLSGLSGCSAPSPTEPVTEAKHPVIATYSILGDWVGVVGGDRVAVSTLVGAGGDAHTYEPTPPDSVALSRAMLVFENGLGFEAWLDDLYTSSRSVGTRIVVTETLTPRSMPPSSGKVEIDPHVWHSPRMAVEMVRAITLALVEADPSHAGEYQQRADLYVAELKTLDVWIQGQVASLPVERRQLFTSHDTFGYFAEDYGFQVHSIMGSVSSEVADPSAAEVAQVIQRIREAQVPAVFSENIINPKLTEQVAREAGVSVVPSLYTDALGPGDSSGGSYLRMMRHNVQTIVEALR